MSVAELFWGWIVPCALQATVLLALAWAIDRALVRRAWPQLLSTLWLVALARLVLPPSIASPWSITRALGTPALEAAAAARAGLALEACAALWLAGTLGLLLARLVRRVRLQRSLRPVRSPAWEGALRHAARAVGLRRPPRLASVPGLASFAVTGLVRPTLLVPSARLGGAPSVRDSHALLHELSHLARRDLWLDEACELLRALFWFHPLVWVATARVRALGELACDESVARRLGREAASYRDTLVLAARERLDACAPHGVRAFLGAPSALVLRIERLDRAFVRSLALVRGASTALAVALAACVLPMAPEAERLALDLRARARAVLAAGARGEPQSCFSLHAAALVLAAPTDPVLDHPGLDPDGD